MKTVCIYHSIDLDGWMSAAIVKHWFNQQEIPNREKEPINTLNFIGYNYGQPIPDLSEYDKVIMCDISFPEYDIDCIIENDNKRLIWIDHHISAINVLDENIEGLRDTKFAACELTWKYFFSNKEMPEIVRLLGRYDCFGHKGTDEEQKVLEFQYGARQVINNYEEAYEYLKWEIRHKDTGNSYIDRIHDNGKSIYGYLCTEAKQAYKNGFKVQFQENTKVDINDYPEIDGIKFRKFICINKERFNPINFGIDYYKDGYDGVASFYFDGINYNFSLYSDTVDCSIIAKQFGGGGHKGASGFIMTNEQFKNLISNL